MVNQVQSVFEQISNIHTVEMKSRRPIKILVVDDHLIVRRGIISLLSLNKEFEVVGEASDGHMALQMVDQYDPDVVLLDIALPVKDGVEVTREIRTQYPRVKVLVLSGYDSEEYVQKILTCGAHGYLLKTTSPEELTSAIKAVIADNAFFSPRISKIILEHYTHGHRGGRLNGESLSHAKGVLSKREREILKLIALGKTHQQIADELNISVRTVDTHRTNIMRKINLHDTASLVRYAIEQGIIPLSR
ncbi:MAG: response regulator transcription factor [Bacteroidetes bacterium]|nr:response regulator transcription factor [Bacteroidota bacterium]